MNKELPKNCIIVVIGGVVAGTSCAYYLAKFGWKDNILIKYDQDLLGGVYMSEDGQTDPVGVTNVIG